MKAEMAQEKVEVEHRIQGFLARAMHLEKELKKMTKKLTNTKCDLGRAHEDV